MSKLVYSGTFQQEANMFHGFDTTVVGYIKTIASNIGELNASWNDDVSSEFLNGFNNCLTEVKSSLDQCHNDINQYFQDLINK